MAYDQVAVLLESYPRIATGQRGQTVWHRARVIERPADELVGNAFLVLVWPYVVLLLRLGKFQAKLCHLKYLDRAKPMTGHGSDVSHLDLEPLRILQGLAILPQRVNSDRPARWVINDGGRGVLAWNKLNGLCHLRRCVAVLPNPRSSGRAEAVGPRGPVGPLPFALADVCAKLSSAKTIQCQNYPGGALRMLSAS